ncbi:MAG: hypothetical protein RI564_09300 [Gracilimonas sp.]|nr:hypothetical protein [Gracilimonas sp.]
MMIRIILILASFLIFGSDLMGQPPGLPDNPDQAPIDGGLGLLAALGGAYAWNKLSKNKDNERNIDS